MSGNPVNNVTVNPMTSCLNQVAITQIVEQFCVSCTVIVIPPPPPVQVEEVPSNSTTTVVQSTTVTVMTSTPVKEVIPYCLPKPVVQANGTISSLVYLAVGRPLGPAERGAVLATYKRGVGMVCPEASQGGGGEALVSSRVPMFTLTVPASFVNQFVRLCVEPARATGKTLCHDVKIDSGATIAIPVTSNVQARVFQTKKTKVAPPKSKQEIAKASAAFGATLSNGTTSAHNHNHNHNHGTTTTTVNPSPAEVAQMAAGTRKGN
jgi:hypothetical protein